MEKKKRETLRMWRQPELLVAADGSVKWFKHSGKHLVAFSKVEHTPSIWSGHSPPRHLSQRKENLGPRGLGHECSPQLHL